MRRWLERTLMLAVIAGGACTCGEGEVVGRIVPRITIGAESLDFGEVPIGLSKRLSIEVANPGGSALTLSALTTSAPFGATAVSLVIPAGSSSLIDVAFAPNDEGTLQGSLQIASDADDAPLKSVSLVGVGVRGFVEISPRRVEFARTTVGTARSVELVIDNRGLESVSGPVSPQRFARPDAYTLGGVNLLRPGQFSAGARAITTLTLDYTPFVVGDDSGRVVFELCGPGCGLEVEIVADAVSAAVRIDPPAIDFGAVGIGQTKSEAVTVWNDGTKVIEVGRARTLGSAETRVSSARPLPATLEPGSSLILTVEYGPQAATEMVGFLSVETSDEAVPEARVRLSGRGAGPLFEVVPEVIDFGIVRRVAPQRRSFVLLNAGSADVRVTGLSYTGHPSMQLVGVPGLPSRLGPGETLTPSVELIPTGTTGRFLGEITVLSDDPANGQVTIPVRAAFSETACEIDAQPSRLNFGLLTPPHTRTLDILVTNRGDQSCVLTAGAFRAPIDPAFTVGAVAWPVTLAVGQAVRIPFTYAPVDLRDSKGDFVITTDDVAFPDRLVSLVGSSKAYDDIFVVPTALDYGLLKPMCIARSRQVRVFNAGTVNAEVSAARVLPAGVTELTSRPVVLPAALPAGGSFDLEFSYAPVDIGADRGDIQIEVPGRPFPLIVSWVGEGALQSEVTDHFEQGRSRPVDVLFVIDDSCSMAEEQVALTTNFGDFIRTANVRSVDFRLALTTTDVTGANAGALRGPILTPGTPNLEAEFQRQAAVGTRGSGFEQGLEAMDAVFRRMPRNGADFLRRNVTMVVIVISDEDDGSPGSPVTYFNSLRGVNSQFFVAVISGQVRGCSNPTVGRATSAPVYESFVALTGGSSLSICAPWSMTLSNLGAAVFGLTSSFALQVAPDLNRPIVVRVNGVVVPMGPWRYDPASQRVVFDIASLPPEGASIDITYSPAC